MRFAAGVLLMVVLFSATMATAQVGTGASTSPKRVLLIHPFGRHFEPYSSAASSFRTALALHAAHPVEFYDVLLETSRFSEEDIDRPQVEYVRLLREQKPLDLVVPIGAPALRFCLRNRELFEGVPLLAAALERRHLGGIDLGQDATAVTFSIDDKGFIEDLLGILPATTNIGFVMGDSPIERFWVSELKREFSRFAGRVEFAWFNELAYSETLERVASLPPNTVVVFGTMDVDAAGVPYEQQDALDALCRAANAPVFGFFEEQVGRGIVGGRVTSARALGALSSEVAIRILGGEPAGSIAPVALAPPRTVYDHRQLARWHIRESVLPKESEIRFRTPGLWATHRSKILLVSSLIVLQALLIGVLIGNRRRLHAARRDLQSSVERTRELHGQLAHSGRVSLMGQMVASLSHELGQPLGAILRNADAAEIFLKNSDPDLEEIRAIFSDIRRDDERAVEVIARLRTLLSRRAVDMQAQDVRRLVDDVMTLMRPDATSRQVTIDNQCSERLPLVLGDRVELQQVLINLLMNAMDAVDAGPAGNRRVTMEAYGNGRAVEFSVRDTGNGVAADQLVTIFDAFVSTRREGMGMGLAISKTIVEAHGGRIWAENHPEGGAVFRFTIPVAEGAVA